MKKSLSVSIVVLVIFLLATVVVTAYPMHFTSRGRFNKDRYNRSGGMMGDGHGLNSEISIHWETYLLLLSEKYAPELSADLQTAWDKRGTMLEELTREDCLETLKNMFDTFQEWREQVRQERLTRDRGAGEQRYLRRDLENRLQTFCMRMKEEWQSPCLPGLTDGSLNRRIILYQLSEALYAEDSEAIAGVLSEILTLELAINDSLAEKLAQSDAE
ncbi:MAG TPA: hypothetical protein VLH40_07195 [Atribacteraceae bacterium]|nr:hypothetical protein [Atribacteraceae bacterium]